MENGKQQQINDLTTHFFECREKIFKNINKIRILKKNPLPQTVWNELTDIEHRSEQELDNLFKQTEKAIEKIESSSTKKKADNNLIQKNGQHRSN